MDDEDSRGYKIRTYLEQTFGSEDWKIITDDTREYFMWNTLLDSYSEKGWKDISKEIDAKVEAWEKEKAQQLSFEKLEKLINETNKKLALILEKLNWSILIFLLP